jgi:hypothetical protein
MTNLAHQDMETIQHKFEENKKLNQINELNNMEKKHAVIIDKIDE